MAKKIKKVKNKTLNLRRKEKPLKFLKSKKNAVRKKKTIKKKVSKKLLKFKKKKIVLKPKKIRPVKYRSPRLNNFAKGKIRPKAYLTGQAVILRKAKLFNRVNKKNKILRNRKSKSHKKPVKKSKPNKNHKKLILKSASFAHSFFKAKIKVIGIGGGGGSIVSEIGRSLDKAKFIIADTDARTFKKRKGIKYFSFGQKLTHGLGTGLNPNLAKEAAEQEKERIAKLFNNEDMVIFVASLGGGVGSGATSVFAEASKKFNGVSFGIFTLPFKFEGKNKQKIASKSLINLRKHLNVSIVIANEKIFKIINSNTSITEAFSTVNRNLIESLESLIDLIYNPGIINIDFADLRTILNGDGNLAFLNTVESSGKDKIEKISKELLVNPLYQYPIIKTEANKNKSNRFVADKILFNIIGGKSLSMFDVDKISKIVAEQNPKAKIIFGISKNSKYKDKIKVTILITGSPLTKESFASKDVPIVSNQIKESTKTTLSKKTKKVHPVKYRKAVILRKAKLFNRVNKNKKIKPIDKPSSDSNNIPINFEGSTKSKVFEELKEAEKVAVNSLTRINEFNSKQTIEKVGTIRRSALEIKKDQEIEENKKSEQEKEWEIPTFLRLKK